MQFGTMANRVDKQALKESIGDTALAFAMNVPIGFGVIAFANWIGIVQVDSNENIQLVVLQTFVFTVIAITRKYFVRVYFKSKENRSASAVH